MYKFECVAEFAGARPGGKLWKMDLPKEAHRGGDQDVNAEDIQKKWVTKRNAEHKSRALEPQGIAHSSNEHDYNNK